MSVGMLADQQSSEGDALQAGTEEKAREVTEASAEVYLKA